MALWNRLGWKGKVLLCGVACSILFLAAAKFDLISFGGSGPAYASFDRRGCLNREFEARFGKHGLDWSDLSESAQSDIASSCAQQEDAARHV